MILGLLIKQFNMLATGQISTPTSPVPKSPQPSITTNSEVNNNKNMISIEYEDANELSLFSAKPVYIDEETDKKFEEILQTAYDPHLEVIHKQNENNNNVTNKTNLNISPVESFLSSSSLDDSIKIYNVPTGEIVKNRNSDNVIQARYESTTPDNIDTTDKTTLVPEHNLINVQDIPLRNYSAEKMKDNKVKSKNEEDLKLPKVKDLAKRFIHYEKEEEDIPKPMPQRRKKSSDYELEVVAKSDKTLTNKTYNHSLTARSISREFREELKLSMATPLKFPGGANEIPEGIEEVTKESSRPSSPLPEPGTIKSKLAFFESLKSAFSSKK